MRRQRPRAMNAVRSEAGGIETTHPLARCLGRSIATKSGVAVLHTGYRCDVRIVGVR